VIDAKLPRIARPGLVWSLTESRAEISALRTSLNRSRRIRRKARPKGQAMRLSVGIQSADFFSAGRFTGSRNIPRSKKFIHLRRGVRERP